MKKLRVRARRINETPLPARPDLSTANARAISLSAVRDYSDLLLQSQGAVDDRSIAGSVLLCMRIAETHPVVGWSPNMSDMGSPHPLETARCKVLEVVADKGRITNLNPKNFHAVKFGVTIWDRRTQTEELIRHCHVVVATGTTLVNGTFDGILNCIQRCRRDYLIYGVTGAGVCELMKWSRWCPYGRSA